MRSLLRASFVFFFTAFLAGACFWLPRHFCLQEAFPEGREPAREALFYEKLSGNNKAVRCLLCPRRCTIAQGARGFCGVRENRGGVLYTLSYARPVTLTSGDPIEKKPFFHFLPSSQTFSLATAGCNLRCKFCQNWEISQRKPEEVEYLYLEPRALIKRVLASGRRVLAYTYSEPTVFYEYMLESAQLARAAGIRTVMHSNGYINEEPLRMLAKYLDAANIDLKGFTEDYYSSLTEGGLAPVLASLKVLKEEGVHLEVTTLLVPGYNDDSDSLRSMCLWIKENLGEDTPLHFSRFFPTYRLLNLDPTPPEALEKARDIAIECGLRYVYIGNMPGHPAETTYCPACKKAVIRRFGYSVWEVNLKDGKCVFCGEEIKGVWS